jgi:threonine 3-dehydrogenase
MKALVKSEAKPGLWMEDVPEPECGNNDLIVKIEKTAICGTDVHIYNWDEWAQKTIKTPQIIGHEFVGEIVEMGSDVTGYSIGERISGEGHIVCGVCRSCRSGRRHLCTNAIGIGVNRNGCFAEYLSLPATNGWHLDLSIPSEIASIFDPLGNATHSTLSFDLVGEDVIITGAGPIGIMSVAIARHVGARKIVITDVNNYRLDIARKMGADLALNVNEHSIHDAIDEFGLIGFDIGLEMSGNPEAFEDMLENMYHGGRIALLGLLPKRSLIDWDQIIFKGLQIKGIYGREIFETWYKMENMVKSGLDISNVITHRFKFENYEKGFDVMKAGISGKVILSF